MQLHGVLIDLDLTLVDSQIAAAARKSRRWPAVYEMIPRFTRYDGVSELLVELSESDIGVCVVTSSPSKYCSLVLEHFEWRGIKKVCYHDTSRRKPDPDPLLRGLQLLEVQSQHAISVGDDPIDTVAARRAGIFSVGALWGALDREALIASKPDALCATVTDLRTLMFERS
jgi:haloacid dehalogenase superfamily, subfamily IA, variant 1 with third motif having Dx(3-4)D or Dx(3-4)E